MENFHTKQSRFPKRSGLLAFLGYSAVSMNPTLPSPVYRYGRRRSESRHIEGPGRSEYIITHHHGSEYQKQSVFASAQPQSLPGRYNRHGPQITNYLPAPPPQPQIRHRFDPRMVQMPPAPPRAPEFHLIPPAHPGHPPGFDQHGHHGHQIQIDRHDSGDDIIAVSDDSDTDQRSPRSLTFGISLAPSNSDKNSSVSLTQACETSLGHDGVTGSKINIEGDKKYKETIFSVSSSRYTNSLDLRMPVEAELVLQPQPKPTEKSLNPLLTWM